MANLMIACGPSSLKMKTLLVSLLSCAAISQAAITPENSGLNGTPTAAKLPYNTSASLEQAVSGLPADFTADLSFQIADNAAIDRIFIRLKAGK